METHVSVCRAMKCQLRPVAPALRGTHLCECLVAVNAKKNKPRAKAIKATIERERNGKIWYYINRSQKDARCGAFHTVQRVVDGVTQESRSQDETEDFIFDEAEVCFHLVAEAPIEWTQLIHQLGYLTLTDSEIAKQIVEGRYTVPDEVDDATALIINKNGRLGVQLTSGDLKIDINPEEFQYFWKWASEGTASSSSNSRHLTPISTAHGDNLGRRGELL